MKTPKMIMFFAVLAVFACAIQAAEPQNFVFSISGGAPILDPHHAYSATEAQIFTAVYEGLFTYDPATLEPVYAACSRSVKSPDGKTWTFYLRKSARWSNGDRITAADFRDAWLRILDPGEKAEYSSLFDVIEGARDYRTGVVKDARKVGLSVIADDILQVKLEYPLSYFTRLLCHHSFSPVHPAMLASGSWDKATAIPCNGPFTYASQDKDSLVLKKNPNYWSANDVRLETIILKTIESAEEATMQYNSGAIHWLAGNFDYDILADTGALELNPMFATYYWYFSCAKAPFDKPEVRRALALLVPWEQIRTKEKYLSPTENLVLPFPGYPGIKGISKADKTEALSLLEKAGFKDHSSIPEITVLISANEDPRRIVGLMKAAWEAEGIKVTVTEINPERFYSATKQYEYTVSSLSWIGDYADPHTFLQMWLKDSNLNEAKYNDPEFERLMKESNTQESKERYNTLGKAEKLLLESGTVMPIYHSPALNIIDTRVIEGWYPNILDIHPFKYLFIGEPQAGPGVVRLGGDSKIALR